MNRKNQRVNHRKKKKSQTHIKAGRNQKGLHAEYSTPACTSKEAGNGTEKVSERDRTDRDELVEHLSRCGTKYAVGV